MEHTHISEVAMHLTGFNITVNQAKKVDWLVCVLGVVFKCVLVGWSFGWCAD